MLLNEAGHPSMPSAMPFMIPPIVCDHPASLKARLNCRELGFTNGPKVCNGRPFIHANIASFTSGRSNKCISTPKSVVKEMTLLQNHATSSTVGPATNQMAHTNATPLLTVSVWPYARVLPGRISLITSPSLRTTSTSIPCNSTPTTGDASLKILIAFIASSRRHLWNMRRVRDMLTKSARAIAL